MAQVKCNWCKEKYDKNLMKVEEKATGKLNKNGTPKISRKYFHKSCHQDYLNDKEFKKNELEHLDNLYQYLLKLHHIEVLDGRMIQKIQDLRNGTVNLNGKKIKRYKDGIDYQMMLITYQQQEENINRSIKNMSFDKKWNEFSYCFGIMLRNINDVVIAEKINRKHEQTISVVGDYQEIKFKDNYKKKKDEIDISSFL